jgi:NAD(P)-dependent dehydrogenase (short-subunit alcohol dehydrogenase family)
MTADMRPDPGIAGKCAIVTGGSRGIGRAIALLLAAEGADVTFFYRGNAEAAEQVLAAGRAAGHTIVAAQVDVRDSAACAAAVEAIADRCGRIDILVNNAGTIRDNPLTAFDDDDVAVVLETNVTGVFNVTPRRGAVYDFPARRANRQHRLRFRRKRAVAARRITRRARARSTLSPARSPSSSRHAGSTSIVSRPA